MRSVVVLSLLVLLVSCATPDPGEDSVLAADTRDQRPAGTAEPGETGIDLTIVNPVDRQRITRPEIVVSALSEEGTLRALEVELSEGPLVTGLQQNEFDIVDIDTLDAPDMLSRLELEGDTAKVVLPQGLVDGALYTVRVRGELEDGRFTNWVEFTTELDLRLELPTIGSLSRTVDSTPDLSVADGYRGSAFTFSVYRDGALVARESSSTGWAGVETPLDPGQYLVSAQAIDVSGFLTRPGPWAELEVLEDAAPRTLWPVDSQTLGPRVGFQWERLGGAAAYELRYRSEGSTSWQPLDEVVENHAPIPVLLQPGADFEWQVRARNDAGRWYSWSRTADFTVGDFEMSFLPVIGTGATVSFLRGTTAGSADEQPVREVTLTEPFEMAELPLSNAQAVRLIELGVQLGWLHVDVNGVRTTDDESLPVVGFGEIDYGSQFGLLFEDGNVVPVPGYEGHPLVGVSWVGANRLARILSVAEGRAPLEGDETTVNAPGTYRLPTEAEWEYSARGESDRLLPWGGVVSGRAANFFRSGDAYEDFTEPFTDAGGPTTPAGYFDGTVRNGMQTIDNASPFGIRDLVGNVWEWTLDRYDPEYYNSGEVNGPMGPQREDFEQPDGPVFIASALDPNQRVVRGTAWNSRSSDVRLTNRGRYAETGRSYSIGARFIRLIAHD